MKVFNKNKGTGAFIFKEAGVRYVIPPDGRFHTVPDAVGKKLIEDYPNTIVGAEEGEKAIASSKGRAAALKAQETKHRATLAEKDAKIAELERHVKALQNLAAGAGPGAAGEEGAGSEGDAASPGPRRGRPPKAST